MQLQLISLLVQLALSPGASDVALARDGQALFTIVTPDRPSESETFAAKELKRYLDLITSATFGISNHRLAVRRAILINGPLEGVDLVFPASFWIQKRSNRIVLSGATPETLLCAVYSFLEECGCRWLAPAYDFYAGRHEVIPIAKKLVYSEGEFHDSPVLRFRKLYVEEGHSHNTDNLLQMIDWMPKLRFNTLVVPTNYQGAGRVKWDNWRTALTPELQRRGITIEVGGHGYQNFISAREKDGKLFELYPEWFGMNEAGKRTPQENRVFCTSNPDAVAHLYRNLLAYLRVHREIQIFDFWPPDGAAWCTCENCQKLGSPSQRHAILVAQTSERVHQEMPNVRIECIAYASYVEPPETVTFDNSVLVDFCPIAQCFEYQMGDPASNVNAKYAHALKGWRTQFNGDISIYSYYRKYAWISLPIIIPHYMQKDLQFYHSLGVHGVSSYSEPGDWFTYELNHYVLGHLAWNPDVDVDRLIREFCSARYGSAADLAQDVFTRLENTTRHACSIPSTSLKPGADYDRYVAEIDACLKEIEQAEQKIGEDATIRPQLARLRLLVQYAQQDIVLQRDAANHVAAEQRRPKVEALARFLKEHSQDGVFVMHSRLGLEALYRNYGVASANEQREAQRKRRLDRGPAATATAP